MSLTVHDILQEAAYRYENNVDSISYSCVTLFSKINNIHGRIMKPTYGQMQRDRRLIVSKVTVQSRFLRSRHMTLV